MGIPGDFSQHSCYQQRAEGLGQAACTTPLVLGWKLGFPAYTPQHGSPRGCRVLPLKEKLCHLLQAQHCSKMFLPETSLGLHRSVSPAPCPSDTPKAPSDGEGTIPRGIAPWQGRETAGEDAMASVHCSDGGTDPKTPRGPCCVVAVEICRLGSRSPPQHNVKWLQDGLSATYICCL